MLKNLLCALVHVFITGCTPTGLHSEGDGPATVAQQFQNDADLLRLEHLIYWTGLIEEFEEEVGHFPLQNDLNSSTPILVRVATRHQQGFFDPSSFRYSVELDNNHDDRFQEVSVGHFVSVLERGLGRPIDEKYDIQTYPTSSPIWYFYFVTEDGYLFYVTCNRCDVSSVSTLLMDGYTVTVNIASPGMVDQVFKAHTREAMLNSSTFMRWQERDYFKEDYIRGLERGNFSDSKL